jgi:hypothetical protein
MNHTVAHRNHFPSVKMAFYPFEKRTKRKRGCFIRMVWLAPGTIRQNGACVVHSMKARGVGRCFNCAMCQHGWSSVCLQTEQREFQAG